MSGRMTSPRTDGETLPVLQQVDECSSRSAPPSVNRFEAELSKQLDRMMIMMDESGMWVAPREIMLITISRPCCCIYNTGTRDFLVLLETSIH